MPVSTAGAGHANRLLQTITGPHLACAEKKDAITGVHKKPIKNTATSSNKYGSNKNNNNNNTAMKDHTKNNALIGRIVLVNIIKCTNATIEVVNQ